MNSAVNTTNDYSNKSVDYMNWNTNYDVVKQVTQIVSDMAKDNVKDISSSLGNAHVFDDIENNVIANSLKSIQNEVFSSTSWNSLSVIKGKKERTKREGIKKFFMCILKSR